ncbi:MAG: hypothetical protein HRT40_12815 [Campylobacteraceae bacterium]|nr:hypothetical protein [Campylobacteraceae bacterium]
MLNIKKYSILCGMTLCLSLVFSSCAAIDKVMPKDELKDIGMKDKVIKAILDSKVLDKSSSDEKVIKTVSDYCKKELKLEDEDSIKAKILTEGCIKYVTPKLKAQLK